MGLMIAVVLAGAVAATSTTIATAAIPPPAAVGVYDTLVDEYQRTKKAETEAKAVGGIISGDVISLESSWHSRLTMKQGKMHAESGSRSRFQSLTIGKYHGGAIMNGDTIFLKSYSGHWLVARDHAVVEETMDSSQFEAGWIILRRSSDNKDGNIEPGDIISLQVPSSGLHLTVANGAVSVALSSKGRSSLLTVEKEALEAQPPYVWSHASKPTSSTAPAVGQQPASSEGNLAFDQKGHAPRGYVWPTGKHPTSMTASTTWLPCWEENTAYLELDIHPSLVQDMVVEDISQCQARCARLPNCAHFSFWTPQRHCHLGDIFARRQKHSLGFVAGPWKCADGEEPSHVSSAKAGWVEGHATNFTGPIFVPPELACVEFDVQYLSTPLLKTSHLKPTSAGVQHISDCQALCIATTGCAYFTVSIDLRRCWLSGDDALRMEPMHRYVSGARSCHSTQRFDRKFLQFSEPLRAAVPWCMLSAFGATLAFALASFARAGRCVQLLGRAELHEYEEVQRMLPMSTSPRHVARVQHILDQTWTDEAEDEKCTLLRTEF